MLNHVNSDNIGASGYMKPITISKFKKKVLAARQKVRSMKNVETEIFKSLPMIRARLNGLPPNLQGRPPIRVRWRARRMRAGSRASPRQR